MTLVVYRATANLPRHELFGPTSQTRRAAVSVARNVAEGYGRNSAGEYKQFLGMARGSNLELQPQLVIATQLGYGNQEQLAEAERLSNEVSKMLNSLLSKI